MKEVWKDIKGYEGYYQVSNLGRVKSLDRIVKSKGVHEYVKVKGSIKTPHKRKEYYGVGLYKNGVCKHFSIHRLVGEAFIPNPDNKPQINHINCFKWDNQAINLEWVTQSENMQHALKYNRFNAPKGKDNYKSIQIDQLDKKHNLLNTFGSIREAERETGIRRYSIKKALNKNKIVGGYYWVEHKEKR